MLDDNGTEPDRYDDLEEAAMYACAALPACIAKCGDPAEAVNMAWEIGWKMFVKKQGGG